jgi:DNA replication protein DnaC
MEDRQEKKSLQNGINPFLEGFLVNLDLRDPQRAARLRERIERERQMTPEEREAAERTRKEAEKRLVRQSTISMLKRNLGFSDEELGMTFDSYEPKTDIQVDALQAVKNAADKWPEEKTSLFLYSPSDKPEWRYGSGKTHLVTAYTLALTEKFVRVRFWYMPDFIKEIKRSWDGRSDSPMEEAIQAEFLVFDDIEKGSWEPGTPVYDDVLTVINARSKLKLPMAATSNLTLMDLGVLFGGSVEDRLFMCVQIPVAGPSGRRSR